VPLGGLASIVFLADAASQRLVKIRIPETIVTGAVSEIKLVRNANDGNNPQSHKEVGSLECKQIQSNSLEKVVCSWL